MCNENYGSKFNSWTLNFLVVVVTGLLSLVLYWHFHDYNIIEYKVDKIEMIKDEYVVGEPLSYRISFCKEGNLDATVLRYVKDTVIYSYPETTSSFEEGCSNFVSTSILTPNVPEGEYRYENTIIYHVNPIKTVKYTIESEPFKIINPANECD